MSDSALEELARDDASRKKFLKMVGGAGATGALGILLAACGGSDKKSSSSTTSSSSSSSSSASTASSSSKGDLAILNYALTLEYLEVDALTATIKKLGGKPVAAPKTNFKPVFDKGLMTVLTTAATVENLGAAAYLGQAPKIKNKEVLAAALAIHTVEARHAAALNQLVGRGFKKGALAGSIPDGAFAKPMSMSKVLAAAKPFIAS